MIHLRCSLRVQLLILVSIAVLFYGKILSFEFVILDDPTLVLENQLLQQQNFEIFSQILNPFALRKQLGTEYLPLRDLSYVVDGYFWDKNPVGFHLTNLLLFALSVALLFCFFSRLPFARPVAFLATLLFILHPIHAESIAWISARKDVLALFLFLASLVAFPVPGQKLHFKRRIVWSWLLFLGALGSKMIVVILPFVLLLCWSEVLQREPKKLKFFVPHFCLAFGWGILAIHIGQESGTVRWNHSILESFIKMQAVFLGNILQLLFPVGLRCYYEPLDIYQYPWFYGGCFLVNILLFWRIWRCQHKRLWWIVIWYLITFLPVSSLIPIPFFKADRYLLLPSIGFCLGVALIFLDRWKQYPTRAIWIFLGVMSTWTLLGWFQIDTWKNSLALAEHASRKAPHLMGTQLILADAYLDQQNFETAIETYQRLVQKHPSAWKAWFNLSRVYRQLQRTQEEIQALKKAYTLTKNLKETLAQHGMVFYRKDGQLIPDVFVGSYIGSLLALLLSEQDDFFQARDIARELYQRSPLWPQAPYTMGSIYAREGIQKRNAGRLTNADGFFQKALHLDANYALAHAKIGEVYWYRTEFKKAQYHFRVAYQLYIQQKDPEEASRLLNWMQQFK